MVRSAFKMRETLAVRLDSYDDKDLYDGDKLKVPNELEVPIRNCQGSKVVLYIVDSLERYKEDFQLTQLLETPGIHVEADPLEGPDWNNRTAYIWIESHHIESIIQGGRDKDEDRSGIDSRCMYDRVCITYWTF